MYVIHLFQPDSLELRGDLVMFQSTTLQGQAGLFQELWLGECHECEFTIDLIAPVLHLLSLCALSNSIERRQNMEAVMSEVHLPTLSAFITSNILTENIFFGEVQAPRTSFTARMIRGGQYYQYIGISQYKMKQYAYRDTPFICNILQYKIFYFYLFFFHRTSLQ